MERDHQDVTRHAEGFSRPVEWMRDGGPRRRRRPAWRRRSVLSTSVSEARRRYRALIVERRAHSAEELQFLARQEAVAVRRARDTAAFA